MEVYALLALAGIGAWLNAQRRPTQMLQQIRPSAQGLDAREAPPPQPARVVPGERPSMNDLYDAKHSQYAAGVEAAKAAAAFRKSQDPNKTQVISPSFPVVGRAAAGHARQSGEVREPGHQTATYSALAGVDIPVEEFTHNNMQPFYRGSQTQSMDPFSTSVRLESLGGVLPSYRSKREVEASAFFPPQRAIGNPFGTSSEAAGAMRDFIVAPRARNNEFPVERQMVGPGIGAGFSSAPQDVYLAQREYAMPKGVDELRVASKPKTSALEARTVDGLRVALGALDKPCVEKRTPDTFRVASCADVLPTTGANLKEVRRPDVILLRDTAKPAAHRPHMGAAYLRQDGTLASRAPQASGGPFRTSLAPLAKGPAAVLGKGRGARDDHGRSSLRVYTTTRETTEARVYAGTLTGALKALVAPLQDLVKTTRKETITESRAGGSGGGALRPQVPAKPTVYDADQVARTTIKQTTLQQAPAGPVRQAAYKISVYDPEDVARVTTRQTLDPVDNGANLGAHRYSGIVYDPNDASARTTTKQTLLQAAPGANLGAHRYSGAVYDPEDGIARTTTKETTIHDAPTVNLRTGEHRGVAAVVDAARVTTRQTLDAADPGANVGTAVPAARAHDPDDVARTTGKETLPGSGRDFGNVEGGRQGGYIVASSLTEAKMTHKQTTADVEYYGQPAAESSDAYIVTSSTIEAKATQKQVLSDRAYVGGASNENKMPTDAAMYYDEARTNALREVVMEGRAPTDEGPKATAGAEQLNVSTTRQLLPPTTDEFAAVDRLPTTLERTEPTCLTRQRNAYKDLDRLDEELLAQVAQASRNDVAISVRQHAARTDDMEDIFGVDAVGDAE